MALNKQEHGYLGKGFRYLIDNAYNNPNGPTPVGALAEAGDNSVSPNGFSAACPWNSFPVGTYAKFKVSQTNIYLSS